MGKTYKLVIVRHAESVWYEYIFIIRSLENKFCGWVDQPLSEEGESNIKDCAKILIEYNYEFSTCFTSVLNRSIKSSWILLEKLNLMHIPQHHSWKLNERHYGILQGMSRTEASKKWGEEQVMKWRRGYDDRPPSITPTEENENETGHYKKKYKETKNLPTSESLKDVVKFFFLL
jgi:2,3-bisphosphoglycerate-dependent phosphoglycerate mutase